MGKIIAIVGKGGVGKTTITYLIAQSLIKMEIKPLLIDADPTMSHLARLLDVKTSRNLEDIRREIIRTASIGTNKEKENLAKNIDQIVEESLIETDKFSILVLGTPEVSGCFCPSNSLLRDVISSIINKFNIILIDCEAGLEQIHRKVLGEVDVILIISDQSLRSLETAQAIRKSAENFIKFKDIYLILNKNRQNSIKSFNDTIRSINIPLLVEIPEDEEIQLSEMKNTSLSDLSKNNPALVEISKIIEKIIFQTS